MKPTTAQVQEYRDTMNTIHAIEAKMAANTDPFRDAQLRKALKMQFDRRRAIIRAAQTPAPAQKVEVVTAPVAYEEITMAGTMVVTSRYNDVDVDDITVTSWED